MSAPYVYYYWHWNVNCTSRTAPDVMNSMPSWKWESASRASHLGPGKRQKCIARTFGDWWKLGTWNSKSKQVWYSYLKTSWAFDIPIHSRALLAAILCWLNSDSVGITTSCSLLTSPLSVSLKSSSLRCLCFLVSNSYSSRLLTIATQSSCLNCWSRLTQVRSHGYGNNVRDIIIAHVISVDTQR